jgi:Leucine-rich repeat (LRR) protein
MPTPIESAAPTTLELYGFLVRNSFDSGAALNDPSSAQTKAYEWLIFDTSLANYPPQQLLQRYAMATLFYATNGNEWLANNLWLSPQSECDWFNKASSLDSCNTDQELVNLELDLNDLAGSLPPELGLLSSLERLTLRGGPVSFLTGTLPSELGYLTRLNVFYVRGNKMAGTIPLEIGNWKSLRELDLSRNDFAGPLPRTIGNFEDLEVFEVSANSLSGLIPTTLGRLQKVTKMYFEDNIFLSPIPTELGNLRSIRELRGGSNVLLSIPSELGRLTSIEILSFKGSNIPGTIPTAIGQLSKIRKFALIVEKSTIFFMCNVR